MIRRVIAGVIAAATLIPLAASAPATASSVSNCNGPDCSTDLSQWIRYSGRGYSPGGPVGHVAVDEQPPPCLWVNIGDQITGSQYIVNFFDGTTLTPGAPFNIYNSLQQAKQLLKDGQPIGTWYNLPINPADNAAQVQACLALPAFVFVLPGGAPPLPHIPAQILAEFAYNHMRLPNPTVTASGRGSGFVNLATFVWWQVPRTMWVTAALPDGQAATVVARVSARASISTSPAGAGTVGTNCGPQGSQHPVGHPPATTAGVAPDCGVLWTRTAQGATVTVTVTWQVVFHEGTSNRFFGQPVPGAGNGITTQGTSNPIDVQQIQSINGG
jgi:hypothetical protein